MLGHNQYKLDFASNQINRVQAPSAPLGMRQMSFSGWRKDFDSYLNRELEENFETFPERCCRGSDYEVQKDLLQAFHVYYLALKQQVSAKPPTGYTTG